MRDEDASTLPTNADQMPKMQIHKENDRRKKPSPLLLHMQSLKIARPCYLIRLLIVGGTFRTYVLPIDQQILDDS